MADRTARATWTGTLTEGSGTVSLDSGILRDSPITWEARTEGSDQVTSPEELLAGAHAACFAMAFTNTVVKAGHAPEDVRVGATCTFGPQEGGGFAVTTMRLSVSATVDGIDAAEFQRLAEAAHEGCPISRVLKGNLEITLDAQLLG